MVRIWQVSADVKSFVYLENLRLTIWGDWLLHLGCLLVIAGLFVTAQWGWYENDIALSAGESHDVGRTGYVISLKSAGGNANASSSEKVVQDTSFELTLPDGQVETHSISMFRPYLRPKLAIFQTDSGPAFRLSAADKDGNPLLVRRLAKETQPAPSVVLKLTDVQNEGYLFMSTLVTTIRVDRYQSLPEEGYNTPVYLVRAYRGSQSSPVFSRYIEHDGSFESQGITYNIRLEDYAVLNVNDDFGWWFVVLGLFLLLTGAILRLQSVPWFACFQSESTGETASGFGKVICWSRWGDKIQESRTMGILLRDAEEMEP